MKLCHRLFLFCFLFALGAKAQAASTFVYCSEGSPTSFNPQITTDGTSNNAAGHPIYNRLVEFKYGTTETIPGLAESWTVSPEGKVYTFKLRKGVKFGSTKYFTPTREFNADDVLFSIERQKDPSHPFHSVNGGNYEFFKAMEVDTLISTVKKLDNFTVEFKLNKPESPFITNMAMSFMSILSKEYADKLMKENKKEDIDNFPIGTGPFVFRSYEKDTLVRFEANPTHWQGAPKIDKLVFAITPDANVRYQKLKTGECHLIIEPAPADINAMKQDSNLKVMEAAGLNVGYLAFNVKKKPFDNLDVRRAIYHALNRASYINAIYMGNAILAKNPLPPTIWSYNDKTEDYPFNLEKAKALLTKAGYPSGFAAELWTLPVTRPYNPNGKKMGEMMQAELAKIGIKITLVTYDWPTYLAKSRNGEHQMIQLGWTGDNGDPDNFLNVLLGCSGMNAGSNVAQWCQKDFNQKVVKAKSIANQETRTKLYKEAQEIFHDRAPWVPVAHAMIYRAMSAKVQGYKIDPLGGDIFREVSLE
mgnify:CR=1 FL=1